MGYEFMRTARYYLSYPISFVLYYLTTPPHLLSRSPSERSPRNRKRIFIVDRKSTRLNSSNANISYAVFCLKKTRQLPPTRRSPFSSSKAALPQLEVSPSRAPSAVPCCCRISFSSAFRVLLRRTPPQ